MPAATTMFPRATQLPERPPSGSCPPGRTGQSATDTWQGGAAIPDRAEAADRTRLLRVVLLLKHGCSLGFAVATPGIGDFRLEGRPIGHAIQPVADRLPGSDRGRLASQHEERGLEGFLSVLLMAQHPPAHTQDRRPVTVDQGLEGSLVTAIDIALRSCRSVARRRPWPRRSREDIAESRESVGWPSRSLLVGFYLLLPARGEPHIVFFSFCDRLLAGPAVAERLQCGAALPGRLGQRCWECRRSAPGGTAASVGSKVGTVSGCLQAGQDVLWPANSGP